MNGIMLEDHGLLTGRLAVHVRAATPRRASGKKEEEANTMI